jgi:hypothetical protein
VRVDCHGCLMRNTRDCSRAAHPVGRRKNSPIPVERYGRSTSSRLRNYHRLRIQRGSCLTERNNDQRYCDWLARKIDSAYVAQYFLSKTTNLERWLILICHIR